MNSIKGSVRAFFVQFVQLGDDWLQVGEGTGLVGGWSVLWRCASRSSTFSTTWAISFFMIYTTAGKTCADFAPVHYNGQLASHINSRGNWSLYLHFGDKYPSKHFVSHGLVLQQGRIQKEPLLHNRKAGGEFLRYVQTWLWLKRQENHEKTNRLTIITNKRDERERRSRLPEIICSSYPHLG